MSLSDLFKESAQKGFEDRQRRIESAREGIKVAREGISNAWAWLKENGKKTGEGMVALGIKTGEGINTLSAFAEGLATNKDVQQEAARYINQKSDELDAAAARKFNETKNWVKDEADKVLQPVRERWNAFTSKVDDATDKAGKKAEEVGDAVVSGAEKGLIFGAGILGVSKDVGVATLKAPEYAARWVGRLLNYTKEMGRQANERIMTRGEKFLQRYYEVDGRNGKVGLSLAKVDYVLSQSSNESSDECDYCRGEASRIRFRRNDLARMLGGGGK